MTLTKLHPEETTAANGGNPRRSVRASFVEGFFDPAASQCAEQSKMMQAILNPTDEDLAEVADLGNEELANGASPLTPLGGLFIFLAIAAPNAVILMLFTDVGSGIETYKALLGMDFYGTALVGLGFLLAFVFYILDFSQWSKCPKYTATVIIVYLLFVGGILKAKSQPQAPFIVLLFHAPLLLVVVRYVICKDTYKHHFYFAIAACSLIVAVAIMVIWLSWIFAGGHEWSRETKDDLIERSLEFYDEWGYPYHKYCSKDKDPDIDEETKYKASKACAKASTTWYLIWIGPMVCGGANFVTFIFCLLRARYLESQDTSRTEGALRMVIIISMILVMGMWIAASIAGASMRLAGTLMSFIMGFSIAMIVWLYFELGHDNIVAAAHKSKLVRSMISFAMSDLARSMFILAMNQFIPFAAVVNAINQSIRKCRGTANNSGCFTERFTRNWEFMMHWNWCTILCYCNWLAIAYFVLMVGVAKATYIFLSVLNKALLNLDLVVVAVIFFLIGYCMFMLPPVPGVPVYIFGGIILAVQASSTSIGFWGGVIMALVLGYTLKLCAVAGQWSIGINLGKSVKIQKMVGVDSVGIRAIEDILKQPGLSLPKVAILVGGPDWPTSVLCGILRLSLVKCVVGTMPCIFIAAPCVLVGAFLVRAEQEAAEGKGGSWGAIAGTTLAVATLGQSGAFMVAGYYMTEVVNAKGDELAKPRPEHKPIEDLTKAEKHYVDTYAQVTAWPVMEGTYKKILKVGTFFQLLCFDLLVWADKECFMPFSLQSDINASVADSPPGLRQPGEKHGNALNIIKPLGRIALIFFVIANILFKIVLRWATNETKKRIAEGRGAPAQNDTETSPSEGPRTTEEESQPPTQPEVSKC